MMLAYNLFFPIQDWLLEDNGIPAANQDISLEVYFSDWEDRQNSKKRGDEAFEKIPISRDV
jgi:hypothetical protein